MYTKIVGPVFRLSMAMIQSRIWKHLSSSGFLKASMKQCSNKHTLALATGEYINEDTGLGAVFMTPRLKDNRLKLYEHTLVGLAKCEVYDVIGCEFTKDYPAQQIIAEAKAAASKVATAASDGPNKSDPLSPVLCLPLPPKMTDPVWKHYHKGTKKYLEDKHHWEIEEMWMHLSRCPDVTSDVRDEAKRMLYSRKKCCVGKENHTLDSNTPATTPCPTPSRVTLQPVYDPPLTLTPETPTPISRSSSSASIISPITPDVFYGKYVSPARFSNTDQAQFNADLCRLLVVCNIAWWAVENPYWRFFFNKWVPGSLMPGQKELSGRVLDEESTKVVNEMLPKVRNSYGTGQCDRWKNITKTSLIASMMNVEYTINLIVGDIFKVKGVFVQCMEGAIEAIKWFNNHSRALGMLKDVQRQKIMKVLALILPVLTRWTSHYLAICRLLELEIVFKQLLLDSRAAVLLCAGKKREAKEKAAEVIGILERIKDHLEPLAIAANVTQSDNTRLDVIVITLANLYRVFSDSTHGFDESISATVLASLEKRWANADRPIFILAIVLNPYICAMFFANDSPFCSFITLWKLVANAYKRLLNTDQEPNHEFCTAFNHYLNRLGDWSDESMSLQYHKDVAIKEDRGVNLITLWRKLKPSLGDDPSSAPEVPQGKRALIELALHIHSATPNSAAMERIFSQFGVKHSKHRNHMHPEKIRKEVLLKTNTLAQFGPPPRQKCVFGNNDSDDAIDINPGPSQDQSSTRTSPDAAPDLLDFGAMARELVADASSNDAPAATLIKRPVAAHVQDATPIINSQPSAVREHDHLTLKHLFHYPDASDTSSTSSKILTEFWVAGEQGFSNEITFHDFIYTEIET
ncbi:hypothetical protein DXG01_001461 [Tephrocybe rancida]|nr:hypothetical protein DXG01_001461 [Tephrocybe rancida]